MRDSSKNVIYVGKANNLKNRVSSYFTNISKSDIKTKILVKNIIAQDIADKAISVGEESFLEIDELKISSSRIGIASKDSSKVEIVLEEIYGSKIRLNFTIEESSTSPKEDYKINQGDKEHPLFMKTLETFEGELLK